MIIPTQNLDIKFEFKVAIFFNNRCDNTFITTYDIVIDTRMNTSVSKQSPAVFAFSAFFSPLKVVTFVVAKIFYFLRFIVCKITPFNNSFIKKKEKKRDLSSKPMKAYILSSKSNLLLEKEHIKPFSKIYKI